MSSKARTQLAGKMAAPTMGDFKRNVDKGFGFKSTPSSPSAAAAPPAARPSPKPESEGMSDSDWDSFVQTHESKNDAYKKALGDRKKSPKKSTPEVYDANE